MIEVGDDRSGLEQVYDDCPLGKQQTFDWLLNPKKTSLCLCCLLQSDNFAVYVRLTSLMAGKQWCRMCTIMIYYEDTCELIFGYASNLALYFQ